MIQQCDSAVALGCRIGNEQAITVIDEVGIAVGTVGRGLTLDRDDVLAVLMTSAATAAAIPALLNCLAPFHSFEKTSVQLLPG